MKKRPTLLLSGIATVLAAVCLLRFNYQRHRNSISRAVLSEPLLTETVQNSPPVATTEAAVAIVESKSPEAGEGNSQVGMRFYAKYLDELCRSLTIEEEDALIARFGKTPEILIGLVFAQSPRSLAWLEEALRLAPNNSLVRYAALAKTDLSKSSFDSGRLQSALELARLAPDDAAPLYAAAYELLKQGSRKEGLQKLKDAQSREQFSSIRGLALEAAINALQSAGRNRIDAQGRVSLQNNGQWEVATVVEIGRLLGLRGPDVTLWGTDEAVGSVVNAYQKAINSPGFDLATYVTARGEELNYLRGIAASPTTKLGQNASMPIEELVREATTELNEFAPFAIFSQDKPGVYHLLAVPERAEFLNRLLNEGDISAMKWVAQTRPDIFHSSDFPPFTMPPEVWRQFFKQNSENRPQ